MDQQDAAVVLRTLQRFIANDRDGSLRFWADDGIFVPPPMWPGSSPVRGVQNVREVFDGFDDEWGHDWPTRLRVESVRTTPMGVVVVFRFRPSGRESGVPTETPLSALYRVRDGKIAEAAFFLDRDGASIAAGIQ
jgi:ketosteroid isomerase-like protein